MNDNKQLIIGTNILSTVVVITADKNTVKELYVNAIAGFRVAIIAAHIMGKYASTKMQVVLIADIASFKILTNEIITIDIIINDETKFIILVIEFEPSIKESAIDVIIKTTTIKITFSAISGPVVETVFIKNCIVLKGVISYKSLRDISLIPSSSRYSFVWSSSELQSVSDSSWKSVATQLKLNTDNNINKTIKIKNILFILLFQHKMLLNFPSSENLEL